LVGGEEADSPGVERDPALLGVLVSFSHVRALRWPMLDR
jgi:hypothetical protein